MKTRMICTCEVDRSHCPSPAHHWPDGATPIVMLCPLHAADVLKKIADTVEQNRRQGVYTDDDWLIAEARAPLRALKEV